MAQIILRYTAFETDAGFLRIKQQYISNSVWLTSFYIHSFTAGLTLFAGFTQFSSKLRTSQIKLHRGFGYIYAYTVLILSAPSGFVLAIYANGHLPSKIGFTILSLLWFWFTFLAVRHIKQRNVKKHQSFMIRSYALALSAITLRIWKFALANTVAPDPLDLYQIVTWLGFIPNLFIAEWIILRINSKKTRSPKNLS
jgi:hypothetical protein